MKNENKTDLNGVSETMLQTLYARAKESGKPKHKIYDQKAIDVVKQLDYDFSAADKDSTMSTGVIARTILLDRMVSEWLENHSEAVVVNIASGMDTRFYRIGNQKILRWYNVDLPDAMRVRERYIQDEDRITNIAASAMDQKWADKIKEKDENVLVIVEGLSMYLSEEDICQIFSVISNRFEHCTVFFEILSPKFVKKDIEKSISKSGAVFTFGAASGEEIARLAPSFKWEGDRSLVEGMEVIFPVFKVIGKIGAVRNISNKIVVLEKTEFDANVETTDYH